MKPSIPLLIMVFVMTVSHALSAAPRVAVYADTGAMEPYITAVCDVATSAGMTVKRVTAQDLVEGALTDHDVIVFPGGTGNGQARSLGEEGSRVVREFAANGGGVIGICAGGYLLCEGYNADTRRVELIAARLWDLSNWARGTSMVRVSTDASEDLRLHFENAPVFEPSTDLSHLSAYGTLATFVTDVVESPANRESISGKHAIIAAPFQNGRVVLFGPHPELTPGQEHLLMSALRWVAGDGDAEPTTQNVLGLGLHN